MEKRLSYIIQITFFSITAVLHLFCLLLLYRARNTRLQPTRRLYLTNLSCAEFFLSVTYAMRRVLLLSGVSFDSKLFYALEIVQNSAIFLWFMLIMTSMAFDRFLEVYFNIRYDVIWSINKTIILLWFAFVLPCVLAAALFAKVDTYHAVRYYNSVYLWPVVEFLVMFITLPIYFYIFRKVKRNKMERRTLRRRLSQISRLSSSGGEDAAIKKRRLRDHIYMPIMLITTFIVFWIVPDQILFFARVFKMQLSLPVLMIIGLLFAVGFACDPLLYVCFSRDIRGTLIKLLRDKN